jgi:hypothetical protein
MNTKRRKVILQDTGNISRHLAQKMIDKGYEVLLRSTETEDPVPFPL